MSEGQKSKDMGECYQGDYTSHQAESSTVPFLEQKCRQALATLYEVMDELRQTGRGIPPADAEILRVALMKTHDKGDSTNVDSTPGSCAVDSTSASTKWSPGGVSSQEQEHRVEPGSVLDSTTGSQIACGDPSDNNDHGTELPIYCRAFRTRDGRHKLPYDVPIRAILDTGAAVTVVQRSIATRANARIHEQKPPLDLYTFTGGQKVECKAYAYLNLCFECCEPNRFRPVKVFLVEDELLPFADAYVSLAVAQAFGHVHFPCKFGV